MSIRLMIADPHEVCRRGIRLLLDEECDLEVVAEAADGESVLSKLEDVEVDVLLLEVSLPRPSAPRVVRAALARRPDLPIVVLTMVEDERFLDEFYRLGVRGYALKKSAVSDLVEAIRAAHQGEYYVAPNLANRLIWHRAESNVGSVTPLSALTPREREICQLVAYGHTNLEIAGMLYISERTVETHRRSIASKLAFKSRAELVRFAIAHGLMAVQE